MVQQSSTPAEAVLGVLGDPRRREIVALLGHDDRTVSELAAALGISLPATLKHLRLLERAGVARTSKSGRTVTCRLVGPSLAAAGDWLDEVQAFWAARLASLAEHFEANGEQG